jgi:hypothetical protein
MRPPKLGMIASTIYAQLAGRETPLARSAGASTTAPAADAPAQFDGPVQVHTSTLAIPTASFIPAAVFALAAIPFFAAIFSTCQVDPEDGHTDLSFHDHRSDHAIACRHCRRHHPRTGAQPARTHGVDYAVIGAVVSFVAAVMMYSFLPTMMLMPVVVLAGALMGAVYRRFAGLEPLSLPEAVTDLSHLIGEHHPARRSHAAIING